MVDAPACPSCGSADVVPIAYGLPGPELEQLVDEGRAALGGCMVSDEAPAWECGACGERFGAEGKNDG